MRRSAVAALLGLVLVGGLAPNAGAANVTIQDFRFSPATVSAGLGTSVRWTNSGSVAHTATSNVSGFFNTGHVNPGSSSTASMRAAGTFAYHCQIHASMHGIVKVPVSLSPGSVATGHAVTVMFASASAPGTWRYDVQRRNGSGAWRTIKSGVSSRTLRFTPQHAGSVSFRARAHNAGGIATGWSPVATVSVS